MNRDRESRPRLVSDGSFFGDSFSNLEIDDNVRILHNLGLDPAGNISPALAFQHDRDSRDRDRDNIRIFLKCLELLVSVETLRHVPSRCWRWRSPPILSPPPPNPHCIFNHSWAGGGGVSANIISEPLIFAIQRTGAW